MVAAEKTPRRLGRGLEALLGTGGGLASSDDGALKSIPIAQVGRNPFQPRTEFNPDELQELEESLKASGLLQPITVRRRPGKDGFELIAGERRLRAATKLGWKEIPAIIKDIDDKTILTLALVENLQRTNLNALEEARGYRRLIDEFQLTQQQVAEAVGKDRTTVTNLLRILSLPDEILLLVEQGTLTPGHARALLALSDPGLAATMAKSVARDGLSVRELEQRVRESNLESVAPSEPVKPTRSPNAAAPNPVLRAIEDDLRRYLQTDVRISPSADSKGKIEVSFFSADDMERLLELILRENKREY